MNRTVACARESEAERSARAARLTTTTSQDLISSGDTCPNFPLTSVPDIDNLDADDLEAPLSEGVYAGVEPSSPGRRRIKIRDELLKKETRVVKPVDARPTGTPRRACVVNQKI